MACEDRDTRAEATCRRRERLEPRGREPGHRREPATPEAGRGSPAGPAGPSGPGSRLVAPRTGSWSASGVLPQVCGTSVRPSREAHAVPLGAATSLTIVP